MNQNGLDVLMNFDPLLRDKIIRGVSSMSGTDRALVMKWIINGRRSTVDQALHIWKGNDWKNAELVTLAWCATYGLNRSNDED